MEERVEYISECNILLRIRTGKEVGESVPKVVTVSDCFIKDDEYDQKSRSIQM